MNLARRQFLLACWLCWWLCGMSVFALDPTKAITQYVHDVWTVNNGLPQNTIGGIAQTPDGYLWFGTQRGLVRFDGLRFTVFNSTNTDAFVNDNIPKLFVDREGTLWIGPDGGGLVRYRNGEFKRYAEQDGFTSFPIRGIRQDGAGDIWIAARDLYRLKDGKFTRWGVKDGLSHWSSSILVDKEGRLWIGTAKGLDLFQDGKFIHYSTEQGLAPGRVWAIHEDQQGNLWIGSAEGMAWNPVNRGGLSLFKDGKFTVYSTQNGLPHNAVNAITEDQEGNLWIATSGGLCRYRDGRFTSSPPKDFLSDSNISSLFVDREGSLWLGTVMGGLNRLRDGKFTTITKADGLPTDAINSVYEDRAGALWIGTRDQGLVRLRNNQITNFSLRQGLADNFVNLVHEETADSLLVATEHGLSRIRGEQVRTFHNYDGSLGGDRMYYITKDAAGRTFLGTGSGVYEFKEGRFTPVPIDIKGNYEVYVIWPSRLGGLWVPSSEGLIYYHEGKTTQYTTSPITTFYEDAAGAFWYGVDSNGIVRFKDGQFTTYTTKMGIPNSQISVILEDQNKNMWIGGIGGLIRISKQELEDYAAGKIKAIAPITFDRSDGLRSTESNYSCKTRDGRLLFATMKGVAMIDPANIRYNKLPPPVVIEQAIADNTSFSLTQPQQLAAGTQNLEFHYAGLSLVAAEKNQYKYQLVGYDKTWIEAGNRRTAYYTNLRPGNYTFRVIASNNDGVWNETGAAYSFYLKPYFWQTWWFYGLCIGGLVLVGFALNNQRTRRVMAREREKTQLKIAELRLEKAQALEAEHNRKTQELEEARRLQLSMLPKGNVRLERLEITGAMRTATEVGGDYYDFLPLPDGRYCVVIGDATGHGMSAGLIVGMVKMGLTGRLQAQPDLKAMMEDLNAALRQSLTHRGVGMCLGAVMLDPATLAVELCSNGMPFPYHFTNGNLRAIELKAQPLGFLKRVQVPTAKLQLQPGEALIWVSDGFEERMNTRNEEWGAEQVAAALTEICQREHSGEAIAQELMAACDRASDGRGNDDDMTIVVMRALANTTTA